MLPFLLWARWTAKKYQGVWKTEPDEIAIKNRYGHVLRELEKKPLNFDRVFEACFRNISDENSFEEGQYLYITFRKENLNLPPQLEKTKGDKATIVLQHQFYDLSVDSIGFTVTLAFNRKKVTVNIPFKHIEILIDPSIGFSLQRFDDEQTL